MKVRLSVGRSLLRWAAALIVCLGLLISLALSAHAQDSDSAKELEPGVQFYETTQTTSVGSEVTLWVYMPAGAEDNLPCVVIAPAGTPMIYGMDLSDEDRAEQLPYVRAGFAVVAYSIDGPVVDNPSNEDVLAGLDAFRKAHAGVSDTFAAIDYIRKNIPQIDPKKIYVAGHSSAGALALLAAESDPRIKACVVYAPACDVYKRSAKAIPTIRPLVPDIATFFRKTSPITNASKLRCPLFIFHADDDTNVPTADNAAFVAAVRKTNKRVTFARVRKGGHTDSMINDGIPQAIAWLKKLAPTPPPQ
ncbi:MAG: prolyl oligopeptidase family serine peptidase [Capsulimonas sp.]|uniref:alpha/beta hydrolase family protein n=1 Tax=Capsulimonas sp. TaxID=2494211 RepID=UPI003265EB55